MRSGRAPSATELGRALGLAEAAVAAAYRALAGAHMIVLRPGTEEIAWAPPFSVVATPFRATAGSQSIAGARSSRWRAARS